MNPRNYPQNIFIVVYVRRESEYLMQLIPCGPRFLKYDTRLSTFQAVILKDLKCKSMDVQVASVFSRPANVGSKLVSH